LGRELVVSRVHAIVPQEKKRERRNRASAAQEGGDELYGIVMLGIRGALNTPKNKAKMWVLTHVSGPEGEWGGIGFKSRGG